MAEKEVFVEHLIKRNMSASGFFLRFLSILVVLAAVASIVVLNVLGITLTALLIYVSYLCFKYTTVEYEYSFLNGELTIDKISGQSRRKTIDTVDLKDAEIVAPAYSDEILRKVNGGIKTANYSSGRGGDDTYSIIMMDTGERIQILFEPSLNMVEAMYHVRPNIVKMPPRNIEELEEEDGISDYDDKLESDN